MMLTIDAPIRDFMSKKVMTVSPQSIMTTVGEMFESAKFHHVPVVEDEVPIGIVSKHDYFKLLDSRTLLKMENFDKKNKKWLGALTVKDVMIKNPFCLQQDDLIGNALNVFLENEIHSIIVIDGKKIVGILTPYDILRGLSLEIADQ